MSETEGNKTKFIKYFNDHRCWEFLQELPPKNLTLSPSNGSSQDWTCISPKESQSEDSSIVNLDLNSLRSDPEAQLKQHKYSKPKKSKNTEAKIGYFSAATYINDDNQRDLLKEPSPFLYPQELEEFAHKVMTKAWRKELYKKESKLKYNERHNNRTRQQADLLNRLYVKEPEIKEFKTITDIDPDFFKIVQGRPIKEKLDIREYIQTVRDVLRTKIITGYREDDIMFIEESIILEQKRIDDIKANFQTYVNAFEDFLFNDHTYSMKVLRESEQLSIVAQDKYDKYKELSKEYGALRSIVYNTEEKWRNSKLYQRFLYLISPMSWRKENDYYYHIKDDLVALQEVNTIFDKYRLNFTDDTFSLQDLINRFVEDCEIQDEPKLYFTSVEQMMDVFQFMELQNLNSLLHAEELAVPLETVKEGMIKAEQMFNLEINSLEEVIEKLSGGIAWEEERARYLEELAMELVNSEFCDLVIHDDILNLHVFVEDVYEACIGPNDANLAVDEMMKAIEIKFREELLTLDQLPSEQVMRLESACYAEEARLMKIAEKAARKLLEVEQLFEKLTKVFAPPHQITQKELKWRSPPANPVKPKPPPPRSLTEQECDYLDFFTDFCHYTDDPKDFGININKPTQDTENDKVPSPFTYIA